MGKLVSNIKNGISVFHWQHGLGIVCDDTEPSYPVIEFESGKRRIVVENLTGEHGEDLYHYEHDLPPVELVRETCLKPKKIVFQGKIHRKNLCSILCPKKTGVV